MTYRITLDGVDIEATHADRDTAIRAAEDFANAHPDITVQVVEPAADGTLTPVHTVTGEITRDTEGNYTTVTCDPVMLAAFAEEGRQRLAQNRAECQRVCDGIVSLLDTTHVQVWPGHYDGDVIHITRTAARALYELAAESRAQVQRLRDLMAERQWGSYEFRLTHEEVRRALDGTAVAGGCDCATCRHRRARDAAAADREAMQTGTRDVYVRKSTDE